MSTGSTAITSTASEARSDGPTAMDTEDVISIDVVNPSEVQSSENRTRLRNKVDESKSFRTGDAVISLHDGMLYEARVVEYDGRNHQCFVHYNGWNKSYDEYVPLENLHKSTPQTIAWMREQNELVKERLQIAEQLGMSVNQLPSNISIEDLRARVSRKQNKRGNARPTRLDTAEDVHVKVAPTRSAKQLAADAAWAIRFTKGDLLMSSLFARAVGKAGDLNAFMGYNLETILGSVPRPDAPPKPTRESFAQFYRSSAASKHKATMVAKAAGTAEADTAANASASASGSKRTKDKGLFLRTVALNGRHAVALPQERAFSACLPAGVRRRIARTPWMWGEDAIGRRLPYDLVLKRTLMLSTWDPTSRVDLAEFDDAYDPVDLGSFSADRRGPSAWYRNWRQSAGPVRDRPHVASERTKARRKREPITSRLLARRVGRTGGAYLIPGVDYRVLKKQLPYHQVPEVEDCDDDVEAYRDRQYLRALAAWQRDNILYLVKWLGVGYLHCDWVTGGVLEQLEGGPRRLLAFRIKQKKASNRKIQDREQYNDYVSYEVTEDKELKTEENGLPRITEYFNPSWVHVDRIVSHRLRSVRAQGAQRQSMLDYLGSNRKVDTGSSSEITGELEYFVKWQKLDYDGCTWETEATLNHPFCEGTGAKALTEFRNRLKAHDEHRPYRSPETIAANIDSAPTGVDLTSLELPEISLHLEGLNALAPELPVKKKASSQGAAGFVNPDQVFKNGYSLRNYQVAGVNWIGANWFYQRNCILADEMGLGKTAQLVTFIDYLVRNGQPGPYLVVSPLSTVNFWRREIERWTDMYAVTYVGNHDARVQARMHEWSWAERDADLVQAEELATSPEAERLWNQWKQAEAVEEGASSSRASSKKRKRQTSVRRKPVAHSNEATEDEADEPKASTAQGSRKRTRGTAAGRKGSKAQSTKRTRLDASGSAAAADETESDQDDDATQSDDDGDSDSVAIVEPPAPAAPARASRTESGRRKMTGVETEKIPESYKFNVLITSYEMAIRDMGPLRKVPWKCIIVDEAQRLKNKASLLFETLKEFPCERRLLLTGTPVQNNMNELWALLNFIHPEKFNDEEDFVRAFLDVKAIGATSLEELAKILRPYMLRRLKTDVERTLPPKTEMIIDVALTSVQKQYYRAVMENNLSILDKGAKTSKHRILNLGMQLRKVCNHPYLMPDAEEREAADCKSYQELNNRLVQVSGKLILLDKLLPKLKAEGHRVLIFSQFTTLLDILEDFLRFKRYTYERLDGNVNATKRQSSIDRFNDPDSDRFVFLLSTRAGGLGITLTAADTVILYDSDWNLQNDAQAQARCHRLGQTKPVMVYRLITRGTYEAEMFAKAATKLTLEKAVLHSIAESVDEQKLDNIKDGRDAPFDRKELEDMLKRGAYNVFKQDDEEVKRFCEEDIDQILQRSKIINITEDKAGGSELSSAFAKATFIADGAGGQEIQLDDPDFWKKLGFQDSSAADTGFGLVEGKRATRKVVRYTESGAQSAFDLDDDGTGRKRRGKKAEQESLAAALAASTAGINAASATGAGTSAGPSSTQPVNDFRRSAKRPRTGGDYPRILENTGIDLGALPPNLQTAFLSSFQKAMLLPPLPDAQAPSTLAARARSKFVIPPEINANGHPTGHHDGIYWTRYLDVSSGKRYFHNWFTSEVTWECPPCPFVRTPDNNLAINFLPNSEWAFAQPQDLVKVIPASKPSVMAALAKRGTPSASATTDAAAASTGSSASKSVIDLVSDTPAQSQDKAPAEEDVSMPPLEPAKSAESVSASTTKAASPPSADASADGTARSTSTAVAMDIVNEKPADAVDSTLSPDARLNGGLDGDKSLADIALEYEFVARNDPKPASVTPESAQTSPAASSHALGPIPSSSITQPAQQSTNAAPSSSRPPSVNSTAALSSAADSSARTNIKRAADGLIDRFLVSNADATHEDLAGFAYAFCERVMLRLEDRWQMHLRSRLMPLVTGLSSNQQANPARRRPNRSPVHSLEQQQYMPHQGPYAANAMMQSIPPRAGQPRYAHTVQTYPLPQAQYSQYAQQHHIQVQQQQQQHSLQHVQHIPPGARNHRATPASVVAVGAPPSRSSHHANGVHPHSQEAAALAVRQFTALANLAQSAVGTNDSARGSKPQSPAEPVRRRSGDPRPRSMDANLAAANPSLAPQQASSLRRGASQSAADASTVATATSEPAKPSFSSSASAFSSTSSAIKSAVGPADPLLPSRPADLPSDMAWNKYVAQLYHWTNDRVCKNFLSDFLKMPQYVPTFQLHQIRGIDMLQMNDDRLIALSVTDASHRARILKSINQVKNPPSSNPSA